MASCYFDLCNHVCTECFNLAQVEHLVMKCLSLGLVKGWQLSIYVLHCHHFFFSTGTIDEVNKEVDMKWVQPRVLDRKQVCAYVVLSLLSLVLIM